MGQSLTNDEELTFLGVVDIIVKKYQALGYGVSCDVDPVNHVVNFIAPPEIEVRMSLELSEYFGDNEVEWEGK